MAEALSRLLAGTAPIIALVLGATKTPMPAPMIIEYNMITPTEASIVSNIRSKSPAATSANPALHNERVPSLSDNLPLSGENTRVTAGIVTSSSPAAEALKFKLSMRKNGIAKFIALVERYITT